MKGRLNKPICAIITSLVLVLGTFAVVLPYQEAEAAPPLNCSSSIPDNTTIDTNIVVDTVGICRLGTNVIVNGNIMITNNSDFICRFATVNGNIISMGARDVSLEGCTVNGNVHVSNAPNFFIGDGSTVERNLNLRGNGFALLNDSTIQGNAHCTNNGGVDVSNMNFLGKNNGCVDS